VGRGERCQPGRQQGVRMRWKVLLLVVVGAAGYLAADAATGDVPRERRSFCDESLCC
jgi:hypothetical protein